ncbi:hypothetical protein GH733_004415, partial [Mirounga leonina]
MKPRGRGEGHSYNFGSEAQDPRPAVPTPSLGSKCQASERHPPSPGAQRTGPWPATAPEGKAGQTRGRGEGRRRQGPGLGEPERAPRGNLPPASPSPARARCPARRARIRALLTAEAALGGHGGRDGVRGARLCSAPGRLPARGAAEEPRGRSGRPRPRRRLEARPAARDGGSARPLLGAPSGQPR